MMWRLIFVLLAVAVYDTYADAAEVDEDDEDNPVNVIKEMDKDGDGLLTHDELHAGVMAKFEDAHDKSDFHERFVPALKEIFPQVDKDGDSKLNPEELAVLMQKFEEHGRREEEM